MKRNDEDLTLRSDQSLILERTELADKYTRLVKEAKIYVGRLTLIKRELRRRRFKRDTPYISDHAVLRYLERVEKLDIDAIREHIESKIPIDPEVTQSNAILLEGFKMKLSKDGKAVTTVLTEDMLDEGAN